MEDESLADKAGMFEFNNQRESLRSAGSLECSSSAARRATNHSTWPDHMTGLVGWWRRVERDGEREGKEMMKQTRLLEERAGKQACKLSFIQKFFPDSNLLDELTRRIVRNNGPGDSC
jgi:hypothetical protein